MVILILIIYTLLVLSFIIFVIYEDLYTNKGRRLKQRILEQEQQTLCKDNLNKEEINQTVTSNAQSNNVLNESKILDPQIIDRQEQLNEIEINSQTHSSVSLPTVTILLPFCNELEVLPRLLKAVSSIEYPANLLEIFLLDDSKQDHRSKIDQIIEPYADRIKCLRRADHKGFKAGNINFGLAKSTGDLVAIFDADCIPSKDFLKKTVSLFLDQKLGYLQTEIKSINAEQNFVTRFLHNECSHKDEITTGLSTEKLFGSLTGSSCIWRRACIEQIGALSDRTLTEDVDLGYRAQFLGWKYLYVHDPISYEELPNTISTLRVQRHRWAHGLIANAFLSLGKLFKFDHTLNLKERASAMILISQSFLLAGFYILLLMSGILVYFSEELGLYFNVLCTIFLLTSLRWGFLNFTHNEQVSNKNPKVHLNDQREADTNNEKVNKDDLFAESDSETIEYKEPLTSIHNNERECSNNFKTTGAFTSKVTSIIEMISMILMYFPLSLYYFVAIIENILGIKGNFNPTPKGGLLNHNQQLPYSNKVLFALEIFSFLYSILTFVSSVLYDNYWIMLYAGLCTLGFLIPLCLASEEKRMKYEAKLEHIVITGATGEIGGALARYYARYGRTLTLTGRNEEILLKLKKDCESLGARVKIKVLDLTQLAQLRAWIKDLANEQAVDLFISCAGQNTNIGENLEGESFENAISLTQINLQVHIAAIDALLPYMKKNKKGQIAILSSLASYYGLVQTPTYSATKAALRMYGNSLRAWLKPFGIKVNVILPGYVDSPMCRAMPGPKPFLMRSDQAVKIIARGLYYNLARISFPFPLNLGIWLLALLPHCLAAPIAEFLGFGRKVHK